MLFILQVLMELTLHYLQILR